MAANKVNKGALRQSLRNAKAMAKMALPQTNKTLEHLNLAIQFAIDDQYKADLTTCRDNVLAYRARVADGIAAIEKALGADKEDPPAASAATTPKPPTGTAPAAHAAGHKDASSPKK